LDGLLVVDKPTGLTSHDVVTRVRRALGVHRVGHTGTLDPDASGVLPLVIGRATRLARFLSADDKHYEAVVRLGFPTTTYDAGGHSTAPQYTGPLPGREDIDRALSQYRGTFAQQPPAYSAKKIGGWPSYKLARRADRLRREGDTGPALADPPRQPAAAVVSTSVVEIVGIDGACVTLSVVCSAGFYVRSLAHDLGTQLGTGAHLIALRRTRSGGAGLAEAVPLASIEDQEHGREAAAAAMIPLSRMLPNLPALVLTDEGVKYAQHGRDLSPAQFANPVDFTNPVNPVSYFRLMDAGGDLVGLAELKSTSGLLHPFVVLV